MLNLSLVAPTIYAWCFRLIQSFVKEPQRWKSPGCFLPSSLGFVFDIPFVPSHTLLLIPTFSSKLTSGDWMSYVAFSLAKPNRTSTGRAYAVHWASQPCVHIHDHHSLFWSDLNTVYTKRALLSYLKARYVHISITDAMESDTRLKVVKGTISTEQWNAARSLIERLYMDENKTFSYVANALQTEHGFFPT